MRIALFGGTFNPIHFGHLLLAESARQRHRLDRVIFIPAGAPPHKNAPTTSAQNRLAMLRLAIRGNPYFEVSDWEVRQKRVVYTVETMAHFKALRPQATWFFLVGEDMLKDLPRWRESGKLRRLCRFIGHPRFDPYASHEIRAQVRAGRSIRYQVPETVAHYIQRHRLYRNQE